MKPTRLQQLDISVRHSAPIALTLLFSVLSVVPVNLPGYAQIVPDFVLMGVFYWTVHRPDLMRTWTVFVVGLLCDVLSGTPLGVTALVLVLVHAIIIAQHKVFRGKSFVIVWWAFALVAPTAHVVTAMIALVATGTVVNSSMLVLRLVLTVMLYPIFAWLLGRAQRAFLSSV